jgi:hypothetical protein
VTTVQVTQVIKGVTALVAATSAFKKAMAASIAQILGLPTENIAILSVKYIEDVTRGRRALGTGSVEVVYTVTAPSTTSEDLQTVLSYSIMSGSFTAALQSNGLPDAVATATPGYITITAAPTSRPTFQATKKDNSLMVMTGSVVGGVVGALILIFLGYQIGKGHLKLPLSKNKVAITASGKEEVAGSELSKGGAAQARSKKSESVQVSRISQMIASQRSLHWEDDVDPFSALEEIHEAPTTGGKMKWKGEEGAEVPRKT